MPTQAEAPEVNPARGREPRQEATARHRRRRNAGSLNRMASFKLDCIDPKALDLENYVYRWVSDENGRLRSATRQDDYDFVTTQELGEAFDADATDSESTERVRMLGGSDKDGKAIFQYLVKKPRDYHVADYEEMVSAREDMMAGRVYGGNLEEQEAAALGEDVAYVPKGVQIGHAAGRRKGPIPRTLLPK